MARMPSARGPGRPPAAKAAETRERIVNAAREVFGEVGYDAATFQEIAARADLTRPAINHYFKSKRILYREVLAQTSELVIINGAKKAFEANSLMGQLDGFIEAATAVDAVDRSVAAFMVTSILETQRHPELRIEEHDALKNSRAFVTWAINNAIERGELVTESPVEPVVEMMLATLWGMGFYTGFVGSHEELQKMSYQFRLLMAGNLWELRDATV